MKVRVKAGERGYYNHIRRRSGDVFILKAVKGHKMVDGKLVPHTFTPEQLFSERWMEKVSESTPQKVTTAQEALDNHSDEIMAAKMTKATKSDEEEEVEAEEAPEIKPKARSRKQPGMKAGTGDAAVI